MPTINDIVERAYRKIGVVATDEAMTADQAKVGLEAFNMMLSGWSLRGVDVLASEMTLADDFPLAMRFQEGTVYMLASRLSPDYQAPAAFDADDWFRTFQAAYMVVPDATLPEYLGATPSQRKVFGGL